MEAAEGTPFSHIKDAELVKVCMQNFSSLALVAQQTLRENEDFDTADYDAERLKVYQTHTLETLTLAAANFGQATVELEGYLFVPIHSLKYLKVKFVHDADDYPPLQLSDQDIDRLKLTFTSEELKQVE
jgi:hypothetical protein